MTAVIICAMSFDPDNPFPGTRAKIDRAREQMDGLKDEFERFYDAKPYEIPQRLDPKTGGRKAVYRITEQFPLRWSVVIGEVPRLQVGARQRRLRRDGFLLRRPA
jgi:hypothetical protein